MLYPSGRTKPLSGQKTAVAFQATAVLNTSHKSAVFVTTSFRPYHPFRLEACHRASGSFPEYQ